MSHLEIDLTNYVDMSSDLVPAGTYRALITDATEGIAKSGNKKVILGLKIIGGEFPGQDIGDARGARIVDQTVTQGAGLFRLAGYLRALGLWRGEQKKLSLDLGSMKGRQVMITVANGEPWNGRIKSEVQDVFRVSKAPKDPDSEPVFSGGLPVVVPPESLGRKMDSDEIDDLVADTVLSRLDSEDLRELREVTGAISARAAIVDGLKNSTPSQETPLADSEVGITDADTVISGLSQGDLEKVTEAMGKIAATVDNLEGARQLSQDELSNLIERTKDGFPSVTEFPPSPESPQVQDLGTVDGNEFSPIDLDNLTL